MSGTQPGRSTRRPTPRSPRELPQRRRLRAGAADAQPPARDLRRDRRERAHEALEALLPRQAAGGEDHRPALLPAGRPDREHGVGDPHDARLRPERLPEGVAVGLRQHDHRVGGPVRPRDRGALARPLHRKVHVLPGDDGDAPLPQAEADEVERQPGADHDVRVEARQAPRQPQVGPQRRPCSRAPVGRMQQARPEAAQQPPRDPVARGPRAIVEDRQPHAGRRREERRRGAADSAISSTSWRSASSPASVNVARTAPLGLRAPRRRIAIRRRPPAGAAAGRGRDGCGGGVRPAGDRSIDAASWTLPVTRHAVLLDFLPARRQSVARRPRRQDSRSGWTAQPLPERADHPCGG